MFLLKSLDCDYLFIQNYNWYKRNCSSLELTILLRASLSNERRQEPGSVAEIHWPDGLKEDCRAAGGGDDGQEDQPGAGRRRNSHARGSNKTDRFSNGTVSNPMRLCTSTVQFCICIYLCTCGYTHARHGWTRLVQMERPEPGRPKNGHKRFSFRLIDPLSLWSIK